MTRLLRRPQPRHEEIVRDTVYQKENLIYIHMYINGSWQVEINGLMRAVKIADTEMDDTGFERSPVVERNSGGLGDIFQSCR